MKVKWKFTRADVERMLILVSAALVVALALRGDETAMSRYEQSQLAQNTAVSSTVQTAAQTKQQDMQNVTVYYQDGQGYLVPVTTQVAKTDGIAKAALSRLVESPENDLAAAKMGLKTVVPEGMTFDLDIAGGRARVDLGKAALSCKNAESESLMVSAVAQTLTSFSSVKEVSFLFDGQARSKLTHGTDVSGVFTDKDLNMETIVTFDAQDTNASLVRLYFPSAAGRMLVPVTRVVYSDADVTTAMVELCRGPKADSGLERAMPEGCAVKSVSLKNGVVTINLTREFAQDENADQVQMLRAIVFTALQFPGVKEVQLQVDGRPYEIPMDVSSGVLNRDTEVMSYYPGVIEMD